MAINFIDVFQQWEQYDVQRYLELENIFACLANICLEQMKLIDWHHQLFLSQTSVRHHSTDWDAYDFTISYTKMTGRLKRAMHYGQFRNLTKIENQIGTKAKLCMENILTSNFCLHILSSTAVKRLNFRAVWLTEDAYKHFPYIGNSVHFCTNLEPL